MSGEAGPGRGQWSALTHSLMFCLMDQDLGPVCLGFPRRAYVSVDIKYNNVPRIGIVILLFRNKLNLDSVWKDFSLLSEPALNHAVISFSTSW